MCFDLLPGGLPRRLGSVGVAADASLGFSASASSVALASLDKTAAVHGAFPASRQPLQRQNRFLYLFSLESELGEHFVNIQNGKPPLNVPARNCTNSSP